MEASGATLMARSSVLKYHNQVRVHDADKRQDGHEDDDGMEVPAVGEHHEQEGEQQRVHDVALVESTESHDRRAAIGGVRHDPVREADSNADHGRGVPALWHTLDGLLHNHETDA